MAIPLYTAHNTPAKKPDTAHAGVWFERFFKGYDSNWQIPRPSDNQAVKKDWIKTVTGKTGNQEQLNSFNLRQQGLLNHLHGQSRCYKTDWYFVTGMGNPHPVENGFSWHPTLAVPYLAGSAVKGLIRAWVELNDEALSETDLRQRLRHWFGTDAKGDVAEQAGAFLFFDAIPYKTPTLICDIMTPHMGKWYEDGDKGDLGKPETIPADWHEPVPVQFLAVKNAEFIFSIAARNHAADGQALDDVFEALKNALKWLGAGAKTATGYGYMSEDEASLTQLRREYLEQAEKDRKEHELQDKLKNLSKSAQAYFKYKQEDKRDWENDKNNFFQKQEIEDWLTQLESNPDQDILVDMVRLLNKHVAGLLDNPNKTQGRKAKPVYSDRQRKIAQRIKTLLAKP